MTWNNKNYHLAVIVILWIILVLNVLSFGKKDSARNLETIKVGGVENMESVQELYKSESYIAQQGAAIDQALSQINMAAIDTVEPTNTDGEENIWEEDINEEEVIIDEENVNNDIVSALKEIKDSAAIHWDEDARFTIIEYSELLCPYCKRQSDQGTINDVIEKYDGEVNAMFRNFIVHGAAAKLWEAIECVWDLWSEDDYFKFIEWAFALNGNLNDESMIGLADELLDIDDDDMKECLDSGKYNAIVNNQTSEWRRLFSVSGTPGNVIVDKLTGKFVLIPGAYPAEKFIEEIEKMKAE